MVTTPLFSWSKRVGRAFVLTRRRFCEALISTGVASSVPLRAKQASGAQILFHNVRIFDGRSPRLTEPTNVLVQGNRIAAIGGSNGSAARVIEGAGRTVMPGLIDAHAHLMMATRSLATLMSADVGHNHLVGASSAGDTLMRGFTSVRDLAGPTFGVRRAIDERMIEGPRIWAAGAMISQRGGHGDFRSVAEITDGEVQAAFIRYGHSAIADGVPQVLAAARDQLMKGANFLKLAAGGGAASPSDPLDVSQYTEEEIRAAVNTAENWGTYVTVHSYTPRAIQTAIRAGVKCIDHGQLMDEETARLLASKGIWLCLQPFLQDEDANPYPPGSDSAAKSIEISEGTDRAYGYAKRFNIKTAWGTDVLFNPKGAARQGAMLAKLKRWYSPAEVLKMATYDNAQLLALSGERTPYRGRLGVVEVDTLADLLLVEGDPLSNLDLIADPAANFVIIMKDGRVYKDALV